MSDDVKVIVIYRKDRHRYLLRYTDPYTGKHHFRSTDAKNRRQADKAAGTWQAELRSGAYASPSKTTWQVFRERYEAEHLASLSRNTSDKAATTLDAVERLLGDGAPRMLRDLTAERVSLFQQKLRDRGIAEASIASHMGHLSAALRWAAGLGLVREAPKITKPKRAKQQKVMKGRPISGEEFERMLKATRAVVGKKAAKSWRWYLRGLWSSGLRLAESLELWWDRDDKLCVDLGGRHPMLRIPAALEKGNRDRVLPIAPEFARLLLRVPEEKRHGRVFQPKPYAKRGERVSEVTVGRVVSAIGKKANIKVASRWKGDVEVVKFASAHDLRRSFGERWANHVMPQVLMELMRHESIETSLKYYVGKNAQRTADVLWNVHNAQVNQSVNQPQKLAKKDTSKTAASKHFKKT